MTKSRMVAAIAMCFAYFSGLTLIFAAPALPSGWYLEANAGRSKISNIHYVSGSKLSHSGLGLNINGGYKFSPYFAAEMGYIKYADATAKVQNVKILSVSQRLYAIAAKAILPVSDTGLDFFAKVGLGRISTNASAQNTNVATANGISVTTGSHAATASYFGLGADYSFIPSMAINSQWQHAKGNSQTGNLDFYSLGVSYLFG